MKVIRARLPCCLDTPHFSLLQLPLETLALSGVTGYLREVALLSWYAPFLAAAAPVGDAGVIGRNWA